MTGIYYFVYYIQLGRGTSTMDGCALASATLQHLVENVHCFTLFVTHYWLLTALEQQYPKFIANYHMSFVENKEEHNNNNNNFSNSESQSQHVDEHNEFATPM